MVTRHLNFAGLYVSEGSRIKRLIHRIVSNRSTADDLLQDAFVKLISHPAAGSIKNEKAYLAQVARNLAIDYCRADKHHIGLEEANLIRLADPTPSAEKALLDQEDLKITFEVIAALPEKTRFIFEKHRMGECTLTEIAAQVGLSASQASRHVMLGYKTIRDELEARHKL